jgi:hypothetical protein
MAGREPKWEQLKMSPNRLRTARFLLFRIPMVLLPKYQVSVGERIEQIQSSDFVEERSDSIYTGCGYFICSDG